MLLLRAPGSIELKVQTVLGRVELTAKRESGQEKTTLIVMGNHINRAALMEHSDLTYEQAQESSLAQAINKLAPYRLPHVEVVYGKPFI